jgi:pimeloyl-ACP methyl ester carboxylesterase
MLVPWLSCDGIEIHAGPLDGMNELSKRIATQSGLVMLRVEKPGLGTSDGPPCSDTDFQTELAGYRAAFDDLRNSEWVDPNRIVLLGMSNGGGILPLVSDGKPVAGYLVVGGWSSTWFEHMLDHLRRSAEANRVDAGEVSSRMQGYAELYAAYLLQKKMPGEVLEQAPRLAAYWDGDSTRQYGRPAAFYHQLQQLNLSAAWSRVASPTLAVWGEYDVIMSRTDHQRIVDLVNRNKTGVARLIVVPKMTHFLFVHESIQDAQRDRGGRFPDTLFAQVNDWLHGVVASPAPAKGAH